jgi:hypothetical protein
MSIASRFWNVLPNTPRLAATLTITGFALAQAVLGAGDVPTSAGSHAAAPVEAFALVGVGGAGDRAFALFDGSDPRFKQVLHRGETIADFTVGDIAAGQVALHSGTGIVHLALGRQLRHQVGAPWELLDLATPFTPAVSPEGPVRSRRTWESFATRDTDSTEGPPDKQPKRDKSEASLARKDLRQSEKASGEAIPARPRSEKPKAILKTEQKVARKQEKLERQEKKKNREVL